MASVSLGYPTPSAKIAPMLPGVIPQDPAQRTGTQKGTDMGQAINALSQTTGLPMLGSSSASGFGVGGGAGGGAAVTMPDTSAATGAAFARGKDQAGSTARAAVNALNDEMGSANMLGSGQEGTQLRQITEHAAAGSNELTREQAIQDATNANDNARMTYQGNITQRGQDINAQQQAAQRQQQMVQGLISALGGLY